MFSGIKNISVPFSAVPFSAVLLLLLWVWCAPALCGDISLALATTVSVTGASATTDASGQATVSVTVTNKGNEPAKNLSLQARLLENRHTTQRIDQIPPGKSHDVVFALPVPRSANGTYPLFLDLHYEHVNGQKVSSVAIASVRTAANLPPSSLAVDVKLKRRWGNKSISAHVSAKNPAISAVALTSFAPPSVTVDQDHRQIRLSKGSADTTFRISGTEGAEGRYVVYVVAEADVNGSHDFTATAITVPIVAAQNIVEQFSRKEWQRAGFALLAVLFFFGLSRSRWRAGGNNSGELEEGSDQYTLIMDMGILAAILLFILVNLHPSSLITSTTTTGGDTASHYYTLDYLRHVLLPSGRVSGWTMGNYAGFPLLQFYFPLPFLLMCLLSVAVPLQVSFKIISILGTFLLPVAVYVMLRCLRRPFPTPILGAIFTLPFLFNSANSMWGANILSTLAGEFSYSLSFALSLILLGTLYHGARHGRWVIGNALLVFLVGFSHGYTLLFVEAVSLFFLITDEGFVKRFVYLLKVYTLGFLLLAFWLVPLLLYTGFTTSYHLVWVINSWREIVPPQIMPFAVMAAIGSIIIPLWAFFQRSDRQVLTVISYLWFGLIASVVFFIAAPKIGVVDIRYVPYGQMMAILMASITLGWLVCYLPDRSLLRTFPFLCLIMVLLWTGGNPGPVSGWARWNYEGFETKPTWPLFQKINNSLKGGFGDPRVMYEHSEEHNAFGSSRAFESLPLFAGRATLEGLYMQASISAPFIFYLQSEVSTAKSAPFPQYEYTTINFERALPHLRLFNVGTLVLRSEGAKRAIRLVAGYRLKESLGDYELWEVTANSGRYVEPLAYEPVLFQTDRWKTDSYRWFMDEKLLDVPLVFEKNGVTEKSPVTLSSDNLTKIPRVPIDTAGCQIRETIGNDEIRIETNWIGKPLLVKVSYHPNWQVEGAKRIYLVSPSFMLIYPEKSTVRLYYGRGWPDRTGGYLTLAGIVILLLNLPLIGKGRTSAWYLLAGRLNVPPSLTPELGVIIPVRVRKIMVAASLCIAALGAFWFCYHSYTNDSNRMFNRAVQLKDAKQFDKARAMFRRVAAEQPFTNLAHDSAYYTAICYYLENNNSDAISAFRKLIEDYPQSQWVPEAWYHIGLCQFRLEQLGEGSATMNRVIRDYPGTVWATYANDRLAEKKPKKQSE
ncbi:MAG: 6-pyruvoyl-tetrahydropterin synthase-related protein [Desulfuromonadaceae bacterium]|nr:6-pyruvoyl-tetrahydropterin synthase-related protein [Desulfuromonadaceae bacterium]MDD5106485.1 6-pyruvoyl-tetrahydropterin synthase-related protein [Desulfuromonadaceae bacterium]